MSRFAEFCRQLTARVIRGLGGVTRDEARASRDILLQDLTAVRDDLLSELRNTMSAACGRIDRLEDRTERLRRGAEEMSAWMQAADAASHAARITSGADQPLVSVILPVWNREDVIRRAIESVLQQTWTNWELFVIDDGSDDDTEAAVRPLLGDSRIHWIPRDHRGVCAARNHGLSLSRSEFIAYLDSDNIWYPHHLQVAIGGLIQHNVAAAYTAQLVCHEASQTSYVRGRTFDPEYFARFGGVDLNAWVHRRSCYERFGGFDEQLTRLVDWDLVGRYARDSAPLFIPHITVRYEEARPGSISVREPFAVNEEIVRTRLEDPCIPRAPKTDAGESKPSGHGRAA